MQRRTWSLVLLGALAAAATGGLFLAGCEDGNDTAEPPPPPAYFRNEPVNGRISFAGRDWQVRSDAAPISPGPNYFTDSGSNVWVDNDGLHLRITHRNGNWQCAELVGEGTFGYGMYRFFLVGRPDLFNENVVLGLYTWDDDPPYDHREADIEFSKWGMVTNQNIQYVVQPYYLDGNMHRFDLPLTGTHSTHSFDWHAGGVDFQSALGHYVDPPATQVVQTWTCSTASVFPPGNEKLHINLWLFSGFPPTDAQETEVVFTNIEFIPGG